MQAKAQQAQVTAVVVTYQSAHTLDDLIAAARRGYDAHVLRCVFVDNNSTDATVPRLLRESEWAEVLVTGKNNGFGRGCNIGLAHVTTPYTIFLNPDAQIEPAAIEALLAFMESHPNVGIAGPATLCGTLGGPYTYQGTSAMPTPWTILRAEIPLLAPHKEVHPIVPGSPAFLTGWVCGAVLMVRTDLAKRLGGFDPRYFMYWEEMDLCRRAKNLGFETWAVGGAVAHHLCGASSDNDDTRISGCIGKYFYQSRRYYMIKHHGWWAATAVELAEFSLLCLRTVSDAIKGKGFGRIRPRLQAPLLSQPDKVIPTIAGAA
jgi:GT2 family glycosyltransferase